MTRLSVVAFSGVSHSVLSRHPLHRVLRSLQARAWRAWTPLSSRVPWCPQNCSHPQWQVAAVRCGRIL